ncbi:hypothetical protein PMIN06_008500 [Paraphaeosphaeria minitans]|uniref:Ankyrin repeat containing protein n=1 Tax=Paraphaeosphaeria minitans TaxID=565426 RepID=A0A9P6GMX8_9PLEO|nr:ankyrin repeat containing protein [Paraphaeosphaeria minitans]
MDLKRRSLQDVIRDVGMHPVSDRQLPLPAPTQPAINASEEDHTLARQLLVEQRVNDPDYRDPGKKLKSVFRSSEKKKKDHDTSQWSFTQDELDRALSAAVERPATSPGLVQAYLNLGAKVNFVEVTDQKSKASKKAVITDRRRSTVLQRAATVRRADTLGLLAASGADQTTLDEGLKAALAANNHPCVQELLRHGADLNKNPNALADAVRSNDQNFVRLLLRAPKALRPDIISSCLPAAVQQNSQPVISLLITHGADPNFDNASALTTSIARCEYRTSVALVAGPIPLSPTSLQAAFEPVMRMTNAQDLYQFLEFLFCCGLPPTNPRLGGLLVAASQRNDLRMAEMLIAYGVPTTVNQAECLKDAVVRSHWKLADIIIGTPISPAHASMALDAVPDDAPKSERLHVISALVAKGGSGRSLERWLVRAVEDGDAGLMDLLLNAGQPLGTGNDRAIQTAVARKDIRSLRSLLASRPSPQSLSQVFPLIRSGYTPSERLETVHLLLERGARGPQVDQSLVDAIADTSTTRDVALITELVRHGAFIDHDDGKAVKLAVSQANLPILRLLCGAKVSTHSKSASLPLIFDTNGARQSTTFAMLELLLVGGVEEASATQALKIAVNGGANNLDIVERLIAADARLISRAFQYAISLSSVSQKEVILKVLLEKGISQETLDQALLAEIQQFSCTSDPTIAQMLLRHGASVNYNGGDAFVASAATGNSSLVKLLLSGKDTPWQPTVTSAFRALFDPANLPRLNQTVPEPASVDRTIQALRQKDFNIITPDNGPESGGYVEVADQLLLLGVDRNATDLALRAVLEPENGLDAIEPIVNRLLVNHADVNAANGVCFLSAAKRSPALFAALLKYKPKFTAILPSLFGAELDEDVLLGLMEECFNHGCTADDLDLSHPASLILVIQKYPRSEALVKKLLNHGCNPEASFSGVMDPAVGEETIPALLWALAQPQKRVSTSVIIALLEAGASATRVAPVSEVAPISLAAREGRSDIVEVLLKHGADASVRDRWNRSALFYASSSSVTSVVETLAPHALKNDGSLHEATRSLQLDAVALLIKADHDPNFPSRHHGGRNALGELCLNAEITNSSHRSRARQVFRLLLDGGVNPRFKARNERSSVILALENAHDPLKMTETLLETEVWEQLNDEKHLFRNDKGLWYSPYSYVELISSPARTAQKQDLLDLLRDKGATPTFYSETEDQPQGATGMPASIARLADRQKEHQLSLRLAKEAAEHARHLEETAHLDLLRRNKEQQDAELAAASAAAAHAAQLEQRQHESAMQKVREAERMKRAEKVAWHSLSTQQESEAAAQRARMEERKSNQAMEAERRMMDARKAEGEHRAGLERRALKDKDDHMSRNLAVQMQIQDRVDESAKLHAGLNGRKQLEWGTVD